MVALTRRAITCPMSLAEILTALWDPQAHRGISVGLPGDPRTPTAFPGDPRPPVGFTYLATSLKVFLRVTVVPLDT